MAITASVETKCEQAMVAGLQNHADLAAINAHANFIRRYADSSKEQNLPACVVRTSEIHTPTNKDANHYTALMEIEAITRKTADPAGDVANSIIAATRDAFATGATFITALESVGGIDVNQTRRPPAYASDLRRSDAGINRTRTLLREIVVTMIPA